MYSLKRKVVFPIIIPRYMLYLSAFLPTCIPTYLHSYLPVYLPTYLPTYNNTIFFKALMVVVAFPQRWAFSVRARQRSKAWITLKDLNRMQFISFNHIYKYLSWRPCLFAAWVCSHQIETLTENKIIFLLQIWTFSLLHLTQVLLSPIGVIFTTLLYLILH